MKKIVPAFIVIWGLLLLACGGDKFPIPQQPDTTDGTIAVGDTVYLQLNPVWGTENGYGFNQPMDILLGREPLIYVADTGNDRILMLDLAGNILGSSQPIPGPVALTQDGKLRLQVVTNSNKVFRIDLVAILNDVLGFYIIVIHYPKFSLRCVSSILPLLIPSM